MFQNIKTILANISTRLRFDVNNQGLTPTEKLNGKTNLELQNIDNTADLNKTVSILQQQAITQAQMNAQNYANGLIVSASLASYAHAQNVASASWTVNHNLGFHPNVTVVDSSGSQVMGDIKHISANQLTINFNAGFSGSAYLS